MSNLIQKIHIENFQTHKDLTIDFGKEITSITGPSDRGKSAIIRALIWVITNRPNGDSFIRYGADECRVTVTVGEHTIQRIKGKKRNCYILDDIEFKALKTDVPIEVQKIFNVSDNNIQAQFDPIFWFSATGGEVARNLNQIVNLDIIDFVLTELQSKFRQNKSEQDVINDLINEQKRILTDAKNIETISGIIRRIENISEEDRKNKIKEQTLQEYISDVCNLKKILEQATMWRKVYDQFEETACKYIANIQNTHGLQKLVANIEQIDRQATVNQIPQNIIVVIDKIYELNNSLKKARNSWKTLKNLVEDVGDINVCIDERNKEAQQIELKLHKILDNNVCPLCGRSKK